MKLTIIYQRNLCNHDCAIARLGWSLRTKLNLITNLCSLNLLLLKRWKELIEKEKIWPFLNWNILCISSDKEKSEALMRIINAGRGRATCYNFNKKFKDMNLKY